ncbi:Glutathione S-transferase S1 [Mortierella polycephala]|uniref:glutathione transferase n=1 Tax=Mortierella polycephala TaxID=41804 RepID=A0A9P6U0F1_9FUNG|nr:Glutathione S-transferase S1 [Mortierella polycephala]
MSSTSELQYRSFHADISTEKSSRILAADPRSVEYELMYFDITCVGASPRYMLSYGKANWHDKFPKTWDDKESHDCPFGVMPVLHVKSEDGQAMVAESVVIDMYLAKKFNLLGSNEYEELTIKAFYSSVHYLRERSLMRVTWTQADKRKEGFEAFMTKMVPWWIKVHEQHLERNGSNGHFFGDKLSLADIHLVSTLDHFAELPRGDKIVALFKASPLLWKVRETVLENPEIAAWRASEGYNKVVEGGKKFYSFCTFEDKSEA